MIVYGKNVLKEIDVKKIKKIYISNPEYISYLQEKKLKYDFVPHQKLDKMVNGNHQGIVMEIHDYSYYNLKDIDDDFIVILDHIEDPHNFGAIIRTCECAGIKYIIIPKDRSVSLNDTVVKVSAGAIEHVKIVMVTNLVNAINELKKKGYFIYSAQMHGENYQKLTYEGKRALVIGNEGKGISRIVLDNSDFIVKIPMRGKINSLNASTAAGILIYGMIDDKY